MEYFLSFILFISIAAGIIVAGKYPLFTIALLFFTGIIIRVFSSTRFFDEDVTLIGFGIRAEDIVMVSMTVAVLSRVFFSHHFKNYLRTAIGKISLLLFFWLLWETVRNIPMYGISAPGEFRFQYLILIIPFYVALYFSSFDGRKKLLKFLLFASLIFPFLCIPFIGFLKGWVFGANENRLFSADISLGIMYSIVTLFLAVRLNYIQWNKILLWYIAIPVFVVLLVDGHRSVWLALGVIVIMLIALSEFKVTKYVWLMIPLFFSVFFIASQLGISIVDFIAERIVAFINPEDDPTASWRLAIWAVQLEKFLSFPMIGEGFGGYWKMYVPELRQELDVSPHSLYVQTLVKTGIIGLTIYFVLLWKTIQKMFAWRILQHKLHHPEYALVLMSILVIIGGHSYFIAYAFDYYTLLYAGVGLSVIMNS